MCCIPATIETCNSALLKLSERRRLSMKGFIACAVACAGLIAAAASAEEAVPGAAAALVPPVPDLYAPSSEYLFAGHTEPYGFDTAAEHVSSIPWLTGGIFAATFAIGITDWDWGSEE